MSELGSTDVGRRARTALVSKLATLNGDEVIDSQGRVGRLEQNLIGCMTVGQLRAVTTQISKGDGGELLEQDETRPKMHSAFSSAALAVNSFACWLGREADLELGAIKGFDKMAFEVKCSVGVRGTAPNLDLIASGAGGRVAVESKCTEYLTQQRADFSDVYAARVTDLAHPSWQAEYEALKADPQRYTWLNAAQLLKHYLGLKNTFQDGGSTLVYLYWQPREALDHLPFAEHREEIDRFADAVSDPELPFAALSYRELWDGWDAVGQGSWLSEHVTELRSRYEVQL